MMCRIVIKKSLCVLAFAMSAAGTVADSDDALEFGVVDAVYQDKSAFVVGDLYKSFDLDMEVFAVDGRKVNRYALHEGLKVVYELNEVDANQVSTIWIKPTSFSGFAETE